MAEAGQKLYIIHGKIMDQGLINSKPDFIKRVAQSAVSQFNLINLVISIAFPISQIHGFVNLQESFQTDFDVMLLKYFIKGQRRIFIKVPKGMIQIKKNVFNSFNPHVLTLKPF